MNERETIAVFKLFLELNDALEKYLIGLTLPEEYWTDPFSGSFVDSYGTGCAYVGKAFLWKVSNEGHEYWKTLDKKWQEVLKDVNNQT